MKFYNVGHKTFETDFSREGSVKNILWEVGHTKSVFLSNCSL